MGCNRFGSILKSAVLRLCPTDFSDHAFGNVNTNVVSQRSQRSGDAATNGAAAHSFLYNPAGAPAMVDTSGTPCRPMLSLDEALDSISPIEAAAASPAVFKFVLSFLDDTGAGRFITSKKNSNAKWFRGPYSTLW